MFFFFLLVNLMLVRRFIFPQNSRPNNCYDIITVREQYFIDRAIVLIFIR